LLTQLTSRAIFRIKMANPLLVYEFCRMISSESSIIVCVGAAVGLRQALLLHLSNALQRPKSLRAVVLRFWRFIHV